MRRLRIGVIGASNFARRIMIPAFKSLSDTFDLVAIASRSKDKAIEFSNAFSIEPLVGYDRLIDRTDIDAIYMPLPTGMHEEWVLKCLEANKHVLVEKSLGVDLTSVKRMVDEASRRKLNLMENLVFGHHSQHQFVRELINDGEIGQIRTVRSQFEFPPLQKDNFRYNPQLGGGSLLDAAPYPIGVSTALLGSSLKVKGAVLQIDHGLGVDVFGSAYLVAGDGTAAQISFGFDNFYQCNYEIFGTTGKITVKKAFTPKPHESPLISLEKPDFQKTFTMNPDDQYCNGLNSFYRAINEATHEEHHSDIINRSRIITEIRECALKNFQ